LSSLGLWTGWGSHFSSSSMGNCARIISRSTPLKCAAPKDLSCFSTGLHHPQVWPGHSFEPKGGRSSSRTSSAIPRNSHLSKRERAARLGTLCSYPGPAGSGAHFCGAHWTHCGRQGRGSVGAPNSGPLGNPNPGQQQHPMGTGVMLGGEVGPADDFAQGCHDQQRGAGTQVWLRTEEGGSCQP
jgi:hypothetical protein